MKKRNISLVILLLISVMFTFQSCQEEEGTLATFGSFTQPILVAPANDAFLSPAGTTVDLKWSSTDAEGDPEKWDIYFGTSDDPDLVKTGHNSQTYTATVAKGNEYFWRVVGTDANGIPTRSETWNFEIVDPDAPMDMTMSWTTNVEDAIGLPLDPDEAVDLRLLILDEEMEEVEVVDGSSFEEFTFTSDMPDGKYYIVTDLFSTINAGDFNSPLDISINLGFNQRGIINQSLPFANVMTNDFACDSYYTILAEVVKTGSTYELTSVAKEEWSADLPSLVGTWTGTDQNDFINDIEATLTDNKLYIYGLGVDMIEGWWGEPVIESNPVQLSFDWTILGGVEIEDQYYFTTTYGGDPYDYNIVGTGKMSLCGESPVLTIEYDIKYSEDGWSIGEYVGELFVAELTFEGTGKGMRVKSAKRISTLRKPVVKPAR